MKPRTTNIKMSTSLSLKIFSIFLCQIYHFLLPKLLRSFAATFLRSCRHTIDDASCKIQSPQWILFGSLCPNLLLLHSPRSSISCRPNFLDLLPPPSSVRADTPSTTRLAKIQPLSWISINRRLAIFEKKETKQGRFEQFPLDSDGDQTISVIRTTFQ